MSKYRIELDRSNQAELAKSAKQNGRSMVKELNVILADAFKVRKLHQLIRDAEPIDRSSLTVDDNDQHANRQLHD